MGQDVEERVCGLLFRERCFDDRAETEIGSRAECSGDVTSSDVVYENTGINSQVSSADKPEPL
jgi:hypothetical protein